MKNRQLSLAEAKTNLSACVREVESGEPVVITRHGKPIVAIVRAEDLEHLKRLRQVGPEGGLASLAGGWEGSGELADIPASSPRLGNRNVVLSPA